MDIQATSVYVILAQKSLIYFSPKVHRGTHLVDVEALYGFVRQNGAAWAGYPDELRASRTKPWCILKGESDGSSYYTKLFGKCMVRVSIYVQLVTSASPPSLPQGCLLDKVLPAPNCYMSKAIHI